MVGRDGTNERGRGWMVATVGQSGIEGEIG
jgi:hypothetical protein